MSSALYTELKWLPSPPSTFAEQCRELRAGTQKQDVGVSLRRLATHALDENQLHRLGRLLRQLRNDGASVPTLLPFRLGILSNGTTDLLLPCLEATALRYGLALECISSGFDQIMQDAHGPDSPINRSRPDAVLLAVDYRFLPLSENQFGQEKEKDGIVRTALSRLTGIRENIKAHGGAFCILQTFAPPAERLFGSLDTSLCGTIPNLAEGVNAALIESMRGSGDLLLDVAGLAATVGLAAWHSPGEWNLAKLPFSSEFLPLYADHVCRLIAAAKGKSRRCLVLDLDNTLWGGVVGDDGLSGLVLAQGDATGEGYRSLQRWALNLRRRGVVLAVSSKNNDETARLPFREHPDMLLKEDDIAVFQANWSDKATNLKAIAEGLSLGLDALVFLDDNPAERALVRGALPEVAVPELPEDPALFARTLAAAGYFESIAFSQEDAKRANFYQNNAQRIALQESNAGNLEAYLESLQMEITFAPFDELGRTRITQLINKSNQFNLITKRYTEAEIAAIEHDPQYFTLQVRLADIFGDNGMVSVAICRNLPAQTWFIDTWLMSCRVLGRRVEQTVLWELVRQAKEQNIQQIQGSFVPTGRNELVRFHYRNLGFIQTSEQPDGSTDWLLRVDSIEVVPPPMKVRSNLG